MGNSFGYSDGTAVFLKDEPNSHLGTDGYKVAEYNRYFDSLGTDRGDVGSYLDAAYQLNGGLGSNSPKIRVAMTDEDEEKFKEVVNKRGGPASRRDVQDLADLANNKAALNKEYDKVKDLDEEGVANYRREKKEFKEERAQYERNKDAYDDLPLDGQAEARKIINKYESKHPEVKSQQLDRDSEGKSDTQVAQHVHEISDDTQSKVPQAAAFNDNLTLTANNLSAALKDLESKGLSGNSIASLDNTPKHGAGDFRDKSSVQGMIM